VRALQVEPFCEPRLFNPFGQVSMGQAQMFIGFVLQASVHGAEEFLWQQTYAPVWAGIIVSSLTLDFMLALSLFNGSLTNFNDLRLIFKVTDRSLITSI